MSQEADVKPPREDADFDEFIGGLQERLSGALVEGFEAAEQERSPDILDGLEEKTIRHYARCYLRLGVALSDLLKR